MSVGNGDYYSVDFEELKSVFTCLVQKHYPHRIPPKEWPSMELIGKAMARG